MLIHGCFWDSSGSGSGLESQTAPYYQATMQKKSCLPPCYVCSSNYHPVMWRFTIKREWSFKKGCLAFPATVFTTNIKYKLYPVIFCANFFFFFAGSSPVREELALKYMNILCLKCDRHIFIHTEFLTAQHLCCLLCIWHHLNNIKFPGILYLTKLILFYSIVPQNFQAYILQLFQHSRLKT